MMKVEGTSALVTGGAKGLGRAIVEALLQNSAKHVCIVDWDNQLGLTTAADLNNIYGPGAVLFFHCDVTKEQQLTNAFRRAIEVFGHLDIVVNNAGICLEDQWQTMVQINMMAMIHGSYLASTHMNMNSGGRGGVIINMASTAALGEIPPLSVYTATKHAMVAFSKTFAVTLDLAPNHGVRVGCLCPSATDTDLMRGILSLPANTIVKFKEILKTRGGFNQVSEVAKAFMYLVTDDEAHGGVLVLTPKELRYRSPSHLVGKTVAKL